jgi:hypothetical protein
MLLFSAKAVTVQCTVVTHLYHPLHVTGIGSRAQAVTLLLILVKHMLEGNSLLHDFQFVMCIC